MISTFDQTKSHILNSTDISKLQEILTNSNKIAITCHYGPDGDAMGSTLGLQSVLSAMGKEATVVIPNKYPNFLAWLPGISNSVVFDEQEEKAKEVLNEADTIFYLDFNTPSRMKEMGDFTSTLNKPVVLIDHHQQPDDFTVNFSDVTASSTCELVYRIVDALGATDKIDVDAATCLYTGLMTDTGSFRFPSTSSKTLRVAADLVEIGVSIGDINIKLNDTNTASRLKILGYSLSEKMVYLEEYKTVFFALTKEELATLNFQKGDTEGIVNYGLSIGGVVMSAFFSEKDGKIKISFRSKGKFSVNEFSRAHFNGGGHTNAAGGISDESWEVTISKFKAAVESNKEQLLSSLA
jgi:phosphoesterase RecJ-like protein